LSDGRCQITGFLFAGDFLGFAGANTQGYTAEAVVPTTVCCLSQSRFMRVLDEFPALERTLLDRATSDLHAAQEQMLLLGRKSARERVASFLVSMCRRQGLRQDDPLLLPMSRADIADHLGLTLETVSRMLSRLREERILAWSETHEAVIADWRRLEQAAGA
jgi:CRP/FNR family transcriptional regulator